MSEIKAGAILNYIRLFVSLGVGFFLSPFILKSLGNAEYGIYTIAGTIVGWLALCDFGLSASSTKFISEYQARGDREGEAHYIGNAALLFSIIGAVVLVAGLCIYPFLGYIFPKFAESELSIYKILYLMTLLNTAFMFPLRCMGGIANARQKYMVPGLAGLISAVLSLCAIVLVLTWGYKSIVLVAVSIVLGVLGMAWDVYYCFAILKAKISFCKLDIQLSRTVFAFSFWMFLDQLINILNTGSGNFIVGMTQGASEVSVYSYGLKLFQYFFMASGCVAGLFLPRVVSAVVNGASNEEQTDMMIKVGRIQLILIGSLYFGILFFGREFFHLWVGESLGTRTEDCWFVTVVIMLPYGFILLQALGWQILQARNAMRYRVSVLAVTSGLSCILGYIFSLHFGMRALAVATSCSIVVGQGIFVTWFYWRRLGLDMPRFFCETLRRGWLWLPLLVVSAVGLNIVFSEPSWSTFILKGVVFMVCYAAILFLFYVREEERLLFLPFFKR